jgi:hypothetical protein
MPSTLASAAALATDPASPLMHPEGLWSVWDRAKRGERQKIVETPLLRAWRR